MPHTLRLAPLMLSVALAGCVNLAPAYDRVAAPVPDALPVSDADTGAADVRGWQDLVESDALESVIQLAVENNRDLRSATARIAIAEAQYGITRAARRSRG
jgi:multidrug efflux system outer membrane protein